MLILLVLPDPTPTMVKKNTDPDLKKIAFMRSKIGTFQRE